MFEHQSQEILNPSRDELIQQFLDQMFSVMKEIHRDISPHEPLLSPPQARLAFTIAKYKDEGISVKELAKIANITPGAITQFTDVLIMKNLVTREEDPNDRRIVRLKLTSVARSHMEKFRKDFLTAASRKLDVLSVEELSQLNILLSKVSSGSFTKDKQG